jgi:hypothetical protein
MLLGREVVQAAIAAGGIDKSKENQVKKAMVDKVNSLQKDGRLVSKHCVSLESYAQRNVFDISKNYCLPLCSGLLIRLLQNMQKIIQGK